jgi:non-heme chloroperoxidase
MAKIRSEAGSTAIDLEVYDSGGDGRPVVLVHGWPLSGHSWKPQKTMLQNAGFRVVAYDRRGFGESDQPADGYDYDTMADDLRAIVEHLRLRGMALVGFSMGGGELARYVGRHGTDGVAAMVFASAVPPFLLRTDDNADGGLDEDTLREMKHGLSADRDGFLADFAEKFYTASGELRVDRDVIENWLALAAPASTKAALDCIDAFSRTDFRDDLRAIDVPTLVIHGDGDEIVPIDVSGRRTAAMIDGAKLQIIHGGPHGILDSHTEEFNQALLDFLLELR